MTQNPSFVLSSSASPFGLVDIGSSAAPTLVDIDGDGDLDAFIGNSDGNIVYFKNSGNIDNAEFSSSSINPFGLVDIGSNANPVFVDIDNDGDYDVFVGGKNGKVVFFKNSGDSNNPLFSVSSVDPFGLTDVGNNAHPAFADIDNDGDLDVFVGNSTGSIVFFRNTGDAENPVFASSSGNPFGLSIVVAYNNPVLVDIDGDGDLDLLVGNGTTPIPVVGTEVGGNVFLFLNTGSLTNPAFSSPEKNPFGLSDVGNYASPTFADIDGDGDLDAFIGNKDGKIKFFLNKIPPGVGIVATQGHNTVEEGGATDVYSVVLKTRPTADVIIALNASHQVILDKYELTFTYQNWNVPQTVVITARDDTILEGNHNGVVAHVVKSDDQNYNNISVDQVWIDIKDNDEPVKSTYFYASSSLNPFGLNLEDSENTSPVFVDIDDDGDFDAFIGRKDGTTAFFRNIGDASTPDFLLEGINPFGLIDVGDNAKPSFSDIDNDGDLDIVFGYTLLFNNTGNASNPAFSSSSNQFSSFGNVALDAVKSVIFPLLGVDTYTAPVFVDVDNDDDIDVLVGNSAGEVLLFENSKSVFGIPIFASPVANPWGLTDVGNNAVPSFVDIDADGDLDAFVGNSNGDIKFFWNLIPGITVDPSEDIKYISEFDGSQIYQIKLDTRPKHDVVIKLDNTSGQISLDKTTLIFTSENWNVAQNFTVTAVNDTVNEGRHIGVVNYTLSSNDVAYDALAVEPMAVVVVDNDSNTRDVTFALLSNTAPFGLTDVGEHAKPTFADIDADGDFDAFVGNNAGEILFFLNNGNASSANFLAAQTNVFGLEDVANVATPILADIDADGDLDAFIGQDTGGLLYFENTGNASSAAFAAASSGAFGLVEEGNVVSPVLVDMDGDDDLDLLVGTSDGNIFYYANTGDMHNAAFAAANTNPFGLFNTGLNPTLTLADVDSDGDLDALMGNNLGEWLYFKNIGGITSPQFAIASTNPFGLSNVGTYIRPELIDIDADGDLDIFVGNKNGQIRYFEGKNHLPTGSLKILGSYQTSLYSWQVFANLQDEDGLGTFTYQWLINGVAVVGATGRSFALVNAELARQDISVRVNYTDGFGTKESVISSAVDLQLRGPLTGSYGHDLLAGTTGADVLTGQAGNDWYWINHSGDIVRENLNAGRDMVISLLAKYTLPTNVEDGRIVLNTGASLSGNALANSLSGGIGDDVLRGLGGADVLYGGAGADTFVLMQAQDSGLNARDVIMDFNAADGDHIDLSAIDANTAIAGKQAFNASILTKNEPFTAAGQLRLELVGTNAILYGNTDTDAEAEFAITLMGLNMMEESCFVLA